MRLFPLGETLAVVTYAGKAEPTVIMRPAFMWAIPLLPNESSITPESELILPVLGDCLKFA
jgi:hypothetical protein